MRERETRESKRVGRSLFQYRHLILKCLVGRPGWNRRLVEVAKSGFWFEQVERNSPRVEAKELLKDKSPFCCRTLVLLASF